MNVSNQKLENLTVLVLTLNEAPNIKRTLDTISWAGQILVLDSGSTDETVEIATQFPQVRVVNRKFTDFADQCNHGLSLISTPWTLSIDADYGFPSNARAAIVEAMKGTSTGYEAAFEYWIYGQAVKGSILPGRTVLYQTDKANYVKDGHGHRVAVAGSIGHLPFRIAHDDRKPFNRWCRSQVTYAGDEAEKLLTTPVSELGRNDRIRSKILFAPLLVFFLSYIIRGGFLSGWRGLFYAAQRFFAELLLSLFLLDRKLAGNDNKQHTEEGRDEEDWRP